MPLLTEELQTSFFLQCSEFSVAHIEVYFQFVALSIAFLRNISITLIKGLAWREWQEWICGVIWALTRCPRAGSLCNCNGNLHVDSWLHSVSVCGSTLVVRNSPVVPLIATNRTLFALLQWKRDPDWESGWHTCTTQLGNNLWTGAVHTSCSCCMYSLQGSNRLQQVKLA